MHVCGQHVTPPGGPSGAACHDAGVRLRAFDPADTDAVLALNQGALPAVSSLDNDRLDALVALVEQVVVVDDGTGAFGSVAGFAMMFGPGSVYDSLNYAWFGARLADFGYLDRVVVSATHRRRSVATTLYDHLEQAARPAGQMACEVNAEPPNVASLAFHAARGYAEVGRLAQPTGTTCAMLVKELSDD